MSVKLPLLLKSKLFIFAACLFTGQIALSQAIERYNSFSYSVNEGLLQSTIADFEFDQNNFCWISFPNGIQKFDGKNFSNVPVQPGLPDDKAVYFFKCSNGDLLLSHAQGVSKYLVGSNKFVSIYKNPFPEKSSAAFMGEADGVIYFFNANRSIIGVNLNNQQIVLETTADFLDLAIPHDYRPKFSNNIINYKLAMIVEHSIYLWDLKKGKLLAHSQPIQEIGYFYLRMLSEDEVTYTCYNEDYALMQYNFKTAVTTRRPIKNKTKGLISRFVPFQWQNKTVLSINGNLFETDANLTEIKSEMVNFQNQPVAGIPAISNIKADNFGNLYLQTITGGMRKIIRNNYSIKYFGSGIKDGNFVQSIFPDKKNNCILAGTTRGLLIFDTLQHLVKEIKSPPGEESYFAVNIIVKTKQGNYVLYASGTSNAWLLSRDFSSLKAIPILSKSGNKIDIDYFGNFTSQNDQGSIVQSQGKFYKMDFAANKITGFETVNSYVLSGMLYGDHIITHANNELIYVDTTNFKIIKTIPFKNTGGVRCFTKDAANNIYIGSNKGVFKTDSNGNILMNLNKQKGLPDECIYAMLIDGEGLLWCSTNKGIFRINKDNSILQLKKENGLQENEFNTNVAARAEDGEFYFGGVNGISSFYPTSVNSFEEKVNLFTTSIKANNEDIFKDSAAWNITELDLPYYKNSLSFEFIAMANNNPDQYIYQYRMDGVDDQWIQNNDLQAVRYFLPPGKYTFKIYASRFFDKDAKPMKEIRIIIQQPFWKTWWFVAAIIFLIIAITAYSINRFIRRKYRKKMRELEAEHKMQLERERISRDLHDSIGAYANAVLYNTELLEKKTDNNERLEVMSDLKFASKDIITALRETIWALKKDNYTASDCFFRLKNFIQPFARYYPHIHFKVEGVAPEETLHYTKALNIVRIVQEAVTNSIKHAGAKNINLNSSNENGKWKLMITDDGKGFDYETEKDNEAGNGLPNMLRRASDSGFYFNIESEMGKQTVVTIIA